MELECFVGLTDKDLLLSIKQPAKRVPHYIAVILHDAMDLLSLSIV